MHAQNPPATGRGKARAFRLALVALSLGLSLLAAEAIFRALDPPEPVFVREDPRFGFANIPNKSGYWQRETETPVLVEINSKGLRDKERPYEKPPGTVRVMMLGDSMVAAFNTPFAEIASSRLEVMLRDSLGVDRIDVINAATQSWGTAQELLFWREEGHRYDPDVVVLHFYTGNDFSNNYAGTAAASKPSFYIEEGELRLRPPQVSPWLLLIRDRFLARSALIRRLRYSPLIVRNPAVKQATARLGLVASDGGALWTKDLAKQMLAVTQLLIVDLAEEVERQGGRFYVYLIPSATDLWRFLPPELHPGGQIPPGEEELRRSLVVRMTEFLEDRGISCIDEWERMVEDSRKGRLLFYHGRGHWSREGNRRAAEDVHRAILPTVRDLVEQQSAVGTQSDHGRPRAG